MFFNAEICRLRGIEEPVVRTVESEPFRQTCRMVPYPALRREEVFTMLNRFYTALFVTILSLLAFANCPAQVNGKLSGKIDVMPFADVREGMRGTARTVFSGSRSEEFGVEILGVVPNWIGPKQDVIIGKLSGANAMRTFVFAGMSGSPVYIDGKLIGAISYSFPFAKEPICGITPYEQMTSIMEQAVAERPNKAEPRTFSFAELRQDKWTPALRTTAVSPLASGFANGSRLMEIAGQTMVPISTPLYFSGVSREVLDEFAPGLARAGVLPIAAAAGSSNPEKLSPITETTLLGGDSVMVFLARGDVQIGAAGTVTHRDGNKIYAFGHPFFGLGGANLPMTESHVVTVIPNANNSFKLAVPDGTVGAMTQDRQTAIYGKLGEPAKMLPVRVKLINSRGKAGEINFEAAFDELLTPLIVNVGVANALTSQERSLGEITVEMQGEIKVKGEEPIRISRRFAGQQGLALASSAAAVPMAALLKANFPGLEITGVDLTMTSKDGGRSGVLERISVDKSEVRAGETVDVTVVERSESGILNTRKIPVRIPENTAPGAITIKIGDGNAVQENSAVTQFTPRTAAELISTINSLKRPDRLYLVVSRSTTGTIIGASELPNLPPSMLATMNSDRSAGGLKSVVQTIIAEAELPPGESIVSGSQALTIQVVR